MEGTEIQGAVFILFSKKGEPLIAPYGPAMYQGILLNGNFKDQLSHKKTTHEFRVTEKLIAELSTHYRTISFSLHYTYVDIRPFQWFNYHSPEKGLFSISVNYTGILDVSRFASFEEYLSSIRSVRRYEYKRAIKSGLKIELSQDIQILDALHEITFKRQNIQRTTQQIEFLQFITKMALSEGFGELLICRTSEGVPIAATLFLFDSKSAYYLYGANNPEYRSCFGGTLLILENIRRCFDRGVKLVDFVGINSPNRGDFKISFNAVPVPYYNVLWKHP